jgi:DNA-binding NtrC family response regulator
MKAAILLIYKNPDIRNSLGLALRSEGHDVTLVSNGPGVLHALRTKGHDLVVLDLDTLAPGGWDTVGEIITISLSLPLIIITGDTCKQQMDLHKGAAAILGKPVDQNTFLEVTKRVLADAPNTRQRMIDSTRA